ncbi:hypothetical protein H072_5008 [Dactylellina haptotyla CBS 200.50]|uniref:DUF2828 domain-containing protein n=1 Tax=Dactylellina haptotyla (strain CBS 200.50) TaxID=1284197 RepID=S8C0J5_DACHA|nr:hypothetical protein H072_5008 [Dactylellina haptotyla CBS 200.50]
MNSNFNIACTTQITTLPPLPELYNPNYLDILLPPPPSYDPVSSIKNSPSAPTNPMMSALEDTTNRVLTQNNAPAYRSTKDHLLDAFHRPTSSAKVAEFENIFTPAWQTDPEVTLRIIFYLRSIHEGKNDRKLFYRAWNWLYTHHPRTAIQNLKQLITGSCTRKAKEGDDRELPGMSHGYWKDLLNILCLAATDRLGTHDYFNLGNGRRVRVFKGIKSRKTRQGTRYEDLCKKLEDDKKFRALYITVARLFAEQLEQDKRIVSQIEATSDKDQKSQLQWKLSLAGKWAPTPGCAHDRITNITTAIAQLLHANRQSHSWSYPSALSKYAHVTPLVADQANILRSYFQRWFLTPIRKESKVPEPLMSAKRWDDIIYNRVSAVCMQNNSGRFYKYDYERFAKYMHDVTMGKKSIAGATLLPHEILMRLIDYDSELRELKPDERDIDKIQADFYKSQINVAVTQWRALVDRLKESGRIENAIAVCDVSGSMGTLSDYKNRKDPSPLFPAMAMSMLLAALAKPPFNSGFITFHQEPEFLKFSELKSMTENVKDLASAKWGGNTDLKKVFTKLLLPLAKQNNVKNEDMIKRLFIFSDMQFDYASTNKFMWETNYDAIASEYKAAGYDVPEIVYWDLGKFDTVEVHADRKGVAMMRGFSGSMMKVFLGEEEEEDVVMVDSGEEEDEDMVVVDKPKDEKDKFTPAGIMRKSVMKNCFDGLVVLD